MPEPLVESIPDTPRVMKVEDVAANLAQYVGARDPHAMRVLRSRITAHQFRKMAAELLAGRPDGTPSDVFGVLLKLQAWAAEDDDKGLRAHAVITQYVHEFHALNSRKVESPGAPIDTADAEVQVARVLRQGSGVHDAIDVGALPPGYKESGEVSIEARISPTPIRVIGPEESGQVLVSENAGRAMADSIQDADFPISSDAPTVRRPLAPDGSLAPGPVTPPRVHKPLEGTLQGRTMPPPPSSKYGVGGEAPSDAFSPVEDTTDVVGEDIQNALARKSVEPEGGAVVEPPVRVRPALKKVAPGGAYSQMGEEKKEPEKK